jgi:lysozyme
MILGVDVSEYQGQMNWQKCKAAGAEFGYFRVGVGPDAIDDEFEVNRENAPEYLPTGGYWAYNPAWPGAGQADLFCDALSTWEWKLRPWIDVELLGGVSAATRTKGLEDFVCRMIQRLRVLPIIYTRAEWFNANLLRRMLWGCCDLAVARYCYLDHPWGDGKCKPKDWTDFLFWQYSADGNGKGAMYGAESDDIDLDCYKGTLPGASIRVRTVRPEWLLSRPSLLAPAAAAAWENVEFEQVSVSGEWVQVGSWVHRDRLK